MSDNIVYEHPLNERTRMLLRLESFFLQAHYFLEGNCLWDSQACITALIELLNHLDRHDLRSELLKELERHLNAFNRLLETPAINRERLNETLSDLTQHIQKLQGMSGKYNQDLRGQELLNMIRQRTTLLGNACSFDVPAYHQWLNQTKQQRVTQLKQWLGGLYPLYEGIRLLLRIIRNSGTFEGKVAEAGFYQRSLDAQSHCHLVRIALPHGSTSYPEVSGGRHRVTIRLLTLPSAGRPKQISENLNFDVCFCVL